MAASNVIKFNSFLAPRHAIRKKLRESAAKNEAFKRTGSNQADRKTLKGVDETLPGDLNSQPEPNEAGRVFLRRLQSADTAEIADMFTRSEEFYAPWVTYPTKFAEVAEFVAHSQDNGVLPFGIRRRSDNVLVGITTLSRIAHEPWSTAECGAVVDVRHRGSGYATEGMRLLVRFALEDLELHRIEALARPENIRSVRMLKTVGFRAEGIARGVIRIQDAWVDHLRWAITVEDLCRI